MLKKLIQKSLLCSLASMMILSCSEVSMLNSNEGLAVFNINFPNKGFSLKAIPEQTTSIDISISGEGLSEAINKSFSKEESTPSVKFTKLPEGKKDIIVKALNDKKIVVAEGKASTNIEKGKVTSVEIELKANTLAKVPVANLLEKLKLVLKNVPSDTVGGIAEIKIGDVKTYQEFTGLELNLTNIPIGNAQIKITVFSSDSTPTANISSEIKIDKTPQADISLEKVELPSSSEVDESSAIPSNLTDLLKKVLVSAPNNKPPRLTGLEIKVNGDNKPYSIGKPICVNLGDKLRIQADTTDENNDVINFVWGITKPREGVLIRKKYDMNFQPERGNVLERNIDFKPGRNFVGFILSDRKSYSGPVTIPFILQDAKCE